jgi:hypothetical protein
LCGISPEFDGKEDEEQIDEEDGSQTQVDDPLRIHIYCDLVWIDIYGVD